MPQQQEEERVAELGDAAKIRYLNADNAEFEKTDGGMLSVRVEGEAHPAVYLHCSFPHTDKRIFISVRTADNKEVGMIRTLDDFPPETAKLLEEQTGIRYFAPEITKVVKIREEFGYSYWDTETTAGPCRFTVRSGGGNVKLVTDCKLLVVDVDGNRFFIADVARLTDKETKMVEMCL